MLFPVRVGVLVAVLTLITCSNLEAGQSCPPVQQRTKEIIQMNGATSPSGEKHPGEILYQDQMDGREWTEKAADVPQSVAWAKLNDVWHPVLRVQMTGIDSMRRITRFGKDGEFLDTTVTAPPPPPPQATPTPIPVPKEN